MSWYAAHLIMYFKFLDGVQSNYTIWENVILIRANTDEEAYEKAKRKGVESEDGSSLTLENNDRPVTLTFAGVRKIFRVLECYAPEMIPTDGTEVTFTKYEIDDEETFLRYVKKEPVKVKCVE